MDEQLREITSGLNVTTEDTNHVIDTCRKIFNGNIDIKNITECTVILMEQVGKIKKLSGKEKKELVTKILIHLVKKTETGEIDETLDKVLIFIIPEVIDKMVSVDKGKLVINPKVSQWTKKCFSCR